MDAHGFLKEHGMEPERVEPAECAPRFLAAMEKGLAGEEGGLPMVPTYLRAEERAPDGVPAAVVDAGGTNFRRALVTFGGGTYRAEGLEKTIMPGVAAPTDFDGFISYTADRLMPLMDLSGRVGFCFSYMALMTPERDGHDPRFTKQVRISGCQGRYICASLREELHRRGVSGKSFTLLNDTAAVMLGVSALAERERYGGFAGLVAGTGINTCCALPADRLKSSAAFGGSMIVNLESGYMKDLPRGDFDEELDQKSGDPGRGWHEKMTSGVYLGELCRTALLRAADEGLVSEKIREAGRMDAAEADAWCAGEGLEAYTQGAEDADFVREVCLSMFDRAARCAASNLGGIMLLTGEGRDRPVCVCAEGSLFSRSRYFRPALEKYLGEYAGSIDRSFEFRSARDATLLGAAAAALTNG